MCGFVGIISKINLQFPENKLKEMNSVIRHRGPDDEGYFQNEWLSLAFRRLKIIDLSEKAHQPMFSADKQFIIVFNGELYNYCEIREELKNAGYHFFSESDTEVILNSFIHWGRDCLDKFTGMFAFIIADLKNKKIFCARDQLGIKPLYIYEDNSNILFTSEIKSLLPYCTLEPNFDAFNEYLVFRSLPGERTMFKNVKSLSAGHFCTCSLDNSMIPTELRISQYFALQDTILPDHSLKFEDACEKVEAHLKESLKIHLRSDVELGVQLSGGVDSSLVTALSSQMTCKKLHSFSISFAELEYDESEYQKRISQRYNTEHHDYRMNEEIFTSIFEKSIWHYEHPLNDPNSVCAYYLALMAKKHITVMLSGEGADESFLGYARFNPESVRNLKFRNFFYTHPSLRKILFNLWQLKKGKKLFNITKYPPAMFTLTYADLNLVDALLNGIFSEMKPRAEIAKFAKNDILTEAILQDEICDLPQWFQRADKMGMAASLEFRVPFCTPQIFTLANAIPYKLKVYNGERKIILKKIAEKFMDKDQIYRKKIGFGTPIDTWINKTGKYATLFEETINSNKFKTRDFINQTHFKKIYSAHKDGSHKEINSGFLWTYFNLELWFRTFFENGWKSFT